MKKSNQTNLPDLPNIGTTQIRVIARASKSTDRYARMVLTGDRNNQSRKAKAILRGAKILNTKIENAHNSVEKKITSEID